MEGQKTARLKQLGKYDRHNDALFRCSRCHATMVFNKKVVAKREIYCWSCGAYLETKCMKREG